MRNASGAETFVRNPVGSWLRVGSSVVWCDCSTRMGVVVWGVPQPDEVAEVLRLFQHWDSLAPRFDVVTDLSRVTNVVPEAFALLVDWSRVNKAMILARIRSRVSVVPVGLPGFALAGIASVVGGLDSVDIVFNSREGYRRTCADAATADALHDEIGEIVTAIGATPAFLMELRAMLDATGGQRNVSAVARALRFSPRSLQRELASNGTSFRQEVADARFRAATALLRESDLKVAAIASRVGITVAALNRLVRSRAGIAPAEFRATLRNK